MAARSKLKAVPIRSAERDALAQIILEAAAAERDAHKARDAKERAEGMVVQAEQRLARAKTDIEQARIADSKALTKAAVAGKRPPASGAAALAKARTAEIGAADALDAAKLALVACEDALIERERELRQAQAAVAKAADAVLRSAPVERLVAKARELQTELVSMRLQLRYLARNILDRHSDPWKAVQSFLHELELPGGEGDPFMIEWDEAPADPWRAAREALMKDADAPLPGGSR